jgi:hypothetical protein
MSRLRPGHRAGNRIRIFATEDARAADLSIVAIASFTGKDTLALVQAALRR